MRRKIKAGEPYEFRQTFKLPESILDNANLNAVGLVLDRATGEVMNAVSVKPAVAGIGSPVYSSGVSVSRNGNVLTLSHPDGGNFKATLVDLSGATVRTVTATGAAEISTYGLSGAYLLLIDSKEGHSSLKLIL